MKNLTPLGCYCLTDAKNSSATASKSQSELIDSDRELSLGSL